MKIGSLVYATCQGLGILAKSFYDHGVITHPLVVRHGRHETHDSWFPGAPQITDLKSQSQQDMARQFCAGCDMMLFLETPFIWSLIPFCRDRGIKTVLFVDYECTTERLPHCPDMFLCPSLLDFFYFADLPYTVDGSLKHGEIVAKTTLPFVTYGGRFVGSKAVFAPVPVGVPWRQRTRAEVFVHNAGHGGLKGRNGTAELLEALALVKSPVKLILRSQDRMLVQAKEGRARVGCVEVFASCGTVEDRWLYDAGDVFIFPERFNGLSLPLQEARAAGMLVMCGDRFPMNSWLPTAVETTTPANREYKTFSNALIPVAGYRKNRIGPPYHEFNEAVFDPKDIAAKIDEWYGKDISEYSLGGKAWAESMSWAALKPKYMATLEALCAS